MTISGFSDVENSSPNLPRGLEDFPNLNKKEIFKINLLVLKNIELHLSVHNYQPYWRQFDS